MLYYNTGLLVTIDALAYRLLRQWSRSSVSVVEKWVSLEQDSDRISNSIELPLVRRAPGNAAMGFMGTRVLSYL